MTFNTFVEAGYTFFTVDPGEYVNNSADTVSLTMLDEESLIFNWDELYPLFLNQSGGQVWAISKGV